MVRREPVESNDNPYRDYYIWRDGSRTAGRRTTTRRSSAGRRGSGTSTTGQYYLHYFAAKQPDLNWENPSVRDEVYDLMRFWLDKGVDGFRMDVIPFISKQPGLPDLDAEQQRPHPEFVYANGPRLHEFLQEMHREVLGARTTR